MVRKLLVVLAAAFGVLWLGAPAFAEPADDAVAAFNSGKHVYLEPGEEFAVDTTRVEQAAGSKAIFFAVFKDGDASALAGSIAQRLSVPPLVVVLVGNKDSAHLRTASTLFCRGATDTAVNDAGPAHRSEIKRGEATNLLVDFVPRFDTMPR